MSSPARLTKSTFGEGWRCPKALWLRAHRPDLATPPDETSLARMREGQVVGALAREHVPGGELVDISSSHPARALEATRAALARGARVLYEAAFEHQGVFVRVDVLRRRPSDGFDLIEVKSATTVADEYLPDLAIQRWVLEGAGLRIEGAGLLLLDEDYVRDGALDPAALFVLHDLTKETRALQGGLGGIVDGFCAVLDRSDAAPEAEIGDVCKKPHPCAFKAHCWAEVPARSIYDVTHLGDAARTELRRRGILRPTDVPPDFPAEPRARTALDAARDGRERWSRDGLRDALAGLTHPLHFLDFETIGPAIPPFDGTSPYDVIPFQFSLHVQDALDGPVRHVAHLGDPAADFRSSVAGRLSDAIGDTGTVLMWTSYEKTCIERLVRWAPPRVAERLASFVPRLWDLAAPFRKRLVVLPQTLGSYSVKQVLPALVPDLSYDDLEIGGGLAAALAFQRMMLPETSADERAALTGHLERYCERDTFAMVRILDALRARTESGDFRSTS